MFTRECFLNGKLLYLPLKRPWLHKENKILTREELSKITEA